MDILGARNVSGNHDSLWIDGKPPRSYEWFMKYWKETAYDAARSVPMSEIVKAGGACIGSPETCLNVLQFLSALLFMQMYTTPHEKIMGSIEMIASKVMPRLSLGRKLVADVTSCRWPASSS